MKFYGKVIGKRLNRNFSRMKAVATLADAPEEMESECEINTSDGPWPTSIRINIPGDFEIGAQVTLLVQVLPSSEDLDVVAAEQKAKEATNG